MYPPINNVTGWQTVQCNVNPMPANALLAPKDTSPPSSYSPFPPSVFPEYISDGAILICPSDPDPAMGNNPTTGEAMWGVPCDNYSLSNWGEKSAGWAAWDESYFYLGWIIDQADREDIDIAPFYDPPVADSRMAPLQVIAALQFIDNAATNSNISEDIDLASNEVTAIMTAIGVGSIEGLGYGNAGSDLILHLKEGIERFLITDINNLASANIGQSSVSIMSDVVSSNPALFNHIPGGMNQLYLDGHVEFSKYPGKDFCSKPFAWVVGLAG